MATYRPLLASPWIDVMLNSLLRLACVPPHFPTIRVPFIKAIFSPSVRGIIRAVRVFCGRRIVCAASYALGGLFHTGGRGVSCQASAHARYCSTEPQ